MVCRLFLVAAILVYLAALALAIIGTQGLFGVQPDGLAAIYVIALGLPWSLGLTVFTFNEAAIPFLQVAAAVLPVVNLWLLRRWCQRRGK